MDLRVYVSAYLPRTRTLRELLKLVVLSGAAAISRLKFQHRLMISQERRLLPGSWEKLGRVLMRQRVWIASRTAPPGGLMHGMHQQPMTSEPPFESSIFHLHSKRGRARAGQRFRLMALCKPSTPFSQRFCVSSHFLVVARREQACDPAAGNTSCDPPESWTARCRSAGLTTA